MKKKIVFFTFMFFLLSLTGALAAVNISLLPSQSEIEAEEMFTVSIEVSGAENLYGYEFGITFDPARFEVLTVREGEFFSRSGQDPTYLLAPILDNGSGTARQIVGVRLTPGAGATGTAMIAQLEFKEKSNEKSDYSSSISFSGQGKLLDPELKPLTVQESNACDIKVSIPNVDPDPDTVGDVNEDGDVDLTDAILCLQTICGIETGETVSTTADVNSDGKIGVAEAIYILRSVSGL